MNHSIRLLIERAVYEGVCGVNAPHEDEIVPIYPDEASDRIMRIIRAEQRRLGV